MKRVCFFLFLLCLNFFAIAQKDSNSKKQEDRNLLFEKVEIAAEYKDGYAVWSKFVEDNIRYPEAAKEHFQPGTEQKVKARFVVGIDSIITDIQILDDPGYGFGEEIIRLINASGKWRPIIQNGRPVKGFSTQEFIFRRSDYKDIIFSVNGFTCSCKYNFNIEDDNKIFDRSGKPAYYPGGEDKWKKFVKENLDKDFKKNEKVEVRFQVDKNGDLSQFELMTRSPAQKYQEIVRVLRLSGKWFPSVQDGYCVKSYIRLTFEL